MSNYVWNKVVCRKEILDQYFIDPDPFGEGRSMDPPYISFNKLFDVKSLNEYNEKYGVYISYGFGFSWNKLSDDFVEIKFCTRWQYPIRAIKQLLKLSHDSIWYAFEENRIYVSKFYWAEGVKEEVLYIEDSFYDWLQENMEYDDLDDPDDGVWHYLPKSTAQWRIWDSSDGFKRYLDVSAVNVDLPSFLREGDRV